MSTIVPGRLLPSELERKIFLLVPRKSAYACLMVARRVKEWLEPMLYHDVCLPTESRAQKFLASVTHRPAFASSRIKALCLATAVHLETAADILVLCSGIQFLNLRFPCHLIGRNPILLPLNNLTHLVSLCVDLSSIFNAHVIHLPDALIFRQVTHLHLTNPWATWYPVANSIGLEELRQITHLSLHLSTIRTHPAILRKILDRDNLAVLVLWRREHVPYQVAIRFLQDFNLVDKRVVILSDEFFVHYLQSGGFWTRIKCVIRLREYSTEDLIVPDVLMLDDSVADSHHTLEVNTDVDSLTESSTGTDDTDEDDSSGISKGSDV